MKSLYGRYLLKGDSLTNSKTKKVLDNYFRTKSGLYVPSSEAGICGGCGSEMHNRKTEFYMGEKFCLDCVSKWKAGYK